MRRWIVAAVVAGAVLFAGGAMFTGAASAQVIAGEGRACGGVTGAKCADGLWCDPKPGQCAPNAAGTCVAVRTFCTLDWNPVCGCNGGTFGNDCARRAAKAGKRKDGECGK